MALFARFSKAAVWLFIRTENLEQDLVFRAQKGIKMVAVHLCPDYLNDTVSEPCLDKACVLDVCMNAATGNRHFFCFKCRIEAHSHHHRHLHLIKLDCSVLEVHGDGVI